MDSGELPTSVELTAEQQLAVERRRGDLLLAAAAGSGKTAVLVERFVRAVLLDGVAPAQILAITFTDRAAGELRERLRRRFLELGEREAARDVAASFVGTFHSFCARMLRLEGLAAGVAADFTTLDDARAARLRTRAFNAALPQVLARSAESLALLAPYEAWRLELIVLGAYAELRSRGQSRPRLPAAPYADDGSVAGRIDAQAAEVCALLDGLLVDFGAHYEALKAARAALDFDDLELRACALLSDHAHIRDSWRERLKLLMVDEVQDVNHRQHALLEALQRDNLFVVGDELQSIYGFRHADVRLFRGRRERLQATGSALALTHNFRSRPQLIEAINAVFGDRFGEGYVPLVAARSAAADEADGAQAGTDHTPLVELLVTDRDYSGVQQAADGDDAPGSRIAEARLLARRIAELLATGSVRAKDVVVLLRSRTGLEAYADALGGEGVPTQEVGGFWDQQPVCDLVAYLSALANPLDELALYGTLASPLVALSSDGLALVSHASRHLRTGAWDAACRLAAVGAAEPADDASDTDAVTEGLWQLADSDRGRLERFCTWFEGERATVAWRGVAGALERMIAASDYERRAIGLADGGRCVANVRKLVRMARDFERQEGSDLRGFLDYVRYASDRATRPEPPAPVTDEQSEAVRLMTIHSAKGLEFDVVCVAELGARPNLDLADLLVDGQRIGLRLARLGEAKTEPSLAFDELAAERREAQEREEDRLLYVALTRARERLLLSGVTSFTRWPEVKEGCAPINWLAPALVADIAQRAAGAREAADLASPTAVPAQPAAQLVAATRWELCLRLNPLVALDPEPPQAVRTPPEPSDSGADAPAASPPAAAADAPSAECSGPSPGEPLTDITYTALSELERCGYRYYLQRVLKLPELAEADGGDRGGDPSPVRVAGMAGNVRGTLVHRLLETLDFAGESEVDAARVAAVAAELEVQAPASECSQIAELLAAARSTELAGRLAASGLRREVPFVFVAGPAETLVTGRLDAVVSEPGGGCLVVDYKSDRVNAADDLAALVDREYGAQRLIYALATLHAGHTDVEVVHWFLDRPHEWVSAHFEATEMTVLQAQLTSRMRQVGTRGYSVSDQPHVGLCTGCPGRGTLCSWTLDATMGSRVGETARD